MGTQLERALLSLAGDDAAEAELLARALRVARATALTYDLDSLATQRFWGALSARSSADSSLSTSQHRDAHRIVLDAARANVAQVAFGEPLDGVREQHAAFCYLMYRGLQWRFIDRHPGESAAEWEDRARKCVLNLTRLIVNGLSKLYARAPRREHDETRTPQHVREALDQVWSDQYDLALLNVDRMVRLQGTIGVRPFYDPESPGGIRLWALLSHQLRVLVDPTRPWRAEAVIERHQPFSARSRVCVWTDRTYVEVLPGGKAWGVAHGLGRIPVVFFRDSMSWTSFFVEGRGRGLCESNAVINSKLTDLAEIQQLQGFSVPTITNGPQGTGVILGPRRILRFKPAQGEPSGLEFKSPGAPLAELRAGVEADILDVFRQENFPPAALGVDLSGSPVSGEAIRNAMQPLQDDLNERGRFFAPPELELADVCCRMLRRHRPGFEYDPATMRPVFTIGWQPLDVPADAGTRLQRDEFDLAHGVVTSAQILRRSDPVLYKTDEEAEEQVQKNVAWQRSLATPVLPTGADGPPEVELPPLPELELPENGNGGARPGLIEALRSLGG